MMAPTATPICHLFNIAFPPLEFVASELPVFRHSSAGGGGQISSSFVSSLEMKRRPSRALASEVVAVDRENDDDAGHDELPFLRDRQYTQAVGKHAHDERADDGAEDRSR